METKYTIEDLKTMQKWSLERKIRVTQLRIMEWYIRHGGNVYVSFSGGKDSTVLLDLARRVFPDIPAVFVDTGLEYPEIKSFVKQFENVKILRPKMTFFEVIKKYGYPLISKEVGETVSQAQISLINKTSKYTYRLKKLNGTLTDKNGKTSQFNMTKYKPLLYVDFKISNKCCEIMKKSPVKQYEKETGEKAITAQMTSESRLRTSQWLKNGCNGFDMKRQVSNPMSFWTEQDVLEYIYRVKTPISSVYGKVEIEPQYSQLCFDFFSNKVEFQTTKCRRTGCIYCGFGCHLEKYPSRFQLLKQTHPKLYDYCINGGEHNEDGIWQPDKYGLGMGYVFDTLNQIYGDDFIRYK